MFATKDFAQDDYVVPPIRGGGRHGREYPSAIFHNMFNGDTDAAQAGDKVVDPTCNRWPWRFANHGQARQRNARISIVRRKVCLVATKAIRAGDEIMVKYWDNFQPQPSPYKKVTRKVTGRVSTKWV